MKNRAESTGMQEHRPVILSVDDQSNNLLALSTLLKGLQAEVVNASSGGQALDIALSRGDIAVILLDVQMPGMDGYQTAQALKLMESTKDIPIIFVTASSDDAEDIHRGYECGAVDFLTKPIVPHILTSKVQVFLEMAQQRRQLQTLVQELEAKQLIIEKDEEMAKQVFEKIVQSSGQDQLYVNYWIKPMSSFSGDMMMSANSSEGLTYVLMCDFTGHGLPAALGALPTSSVFYTMARKGRSMHNIVMEINDTLLELLPTSHFCCASIMVLDHDKQSCSYWNAGLPAMLLVSQEGEIRASMTANHVPLGIVPYKIEEVDPVEVTLLPGDSLYVYSDGLTEADNVAGEMFNESRLRDALAVPNTSGGRIPHVRALVEKFIDGNDQSDDISILELVA